VISLAIKENKKLAELERQLVAEIIEANSNVITEMGKHADFNSMRAGCFGILMQLQHIAMQDIESILIKAQHMTDGDLNVDG